jgi:hypothetical protein
MKVPSILPDGFEIPPGKENEKFKIRLMSQDDTGHEYEALMSSGDYLRSSSYFDPSDQVWPSKDMKVHAVWARLGSAPWEHYKRTVFHYGVFTIDEMQQLAGFTVGYSNSPTHKAQVVLWVRESAANKGEDEEVFDFIKSWLASDWPMDISEVAFPGWEHDWAPFSRGKFVPDDFEVPNEICAAGSYFVLMGIDDFLADYHACFDETDHLEGLFGPDEKEWPAPDVTPMIHLGDLGWCEHSHYHRHFFAYAVYTEDKKRMRGSLYVHPTHAQGYEAEVVTWVVKEDYDNGYDQELFDWAKQWVESEWCFEKIGCPGRDIDWHTWSKIPKK